MPTDDISPEWISLEAYKEFEDEGEPRAVLKDLVELGEGVYFTNQIVDVEGDSPMLNYSTKSDEGRNMLSLEPARDPESDGSSGDDEDRFLRVRAMFTREFQDQMQKPIEKILEQLDGFALTSLDFVYELNREFSTLEDIRTIDEATDHEIIGIQIRQNPYSYIIREEEDGTFVVAQLEEYTSVSPEEGRTFIPTQRDIASDFVNNVAFGE